VARAVVDAALTFTFTFTFTLTLTLTLTWSLTATATATISSAKLGKHPNDTSNQVEAMPVSILAERAEAADDIEHGSSFHG
jgi:hypothetical protein